MNVIGAGGGKSGAGGGGISEDPDTLSSVAFARFVDLICEGPIVGLVNNDYSIYLDGVPLKAVDGTVNYKPYRYAPTKGYQSQSAISGFTGTLEEVGVGVKLTVSAGRLARSIPDAEADAVRVTVSVNGLSETTSDGKIQGASVRYKIWARVTSGVWKVIKEAEIKGKTRSRYQRSYEVKLSGLGAGPYEIGIERITADSASSLLINDIFWDSYTIVNYEKFSYPNSALCGIELDSRYFSQVPSRAYHIKGLIVKVPTNYDPVTRKYATTGPGTTAGAWDGTFKLAYTNNPAWVYYDICTNPRYGLGRRISSSQISKWELYSIAKYCDGRVPTGNSLNVFSESGSAGFSVGGKVNAGVPLSRSNLEPRFTINCVINTVEDAYKVLNYISSVFRGMTYWSSGMISLSQDRPADPVMQWTNANVIGGRFNYEGSGRNDRYTTVVVGWNDPSEDFKQRYEYIEDRDGIARYGIRQTEMFAFGCTSRSQARRAGLWLLYTQRLQDSVIKFQAGLDSAQVVPGDVGEVMDTKRAGVRWGGRLVASTTTTVTLDEPVTLTAGTYTLSVMSMAGSVIKRSVVIAAPGTFSTLTVTVAYSPAPVNMSLWTLSSDVLQPRLVRVISNKDMGNGRYEINVLNEEPAKHNAIELGAAFEDGNYSLLNLSVFPVVANLQVIENSYKPNRTAAAISDLELSWDPTNDPLIRGYQIKVVGPKGTKFPLVETSETAYELKSIVPGSYTVSVSPVNSLGRVGAATTQTRVVTGIDTTKPLNVEQVSLTYTIEPTIGVRLSWAAVEDYIDVYEIRSGTVWETAAFVARVRATSHIVGLITGNMNYLVKARDFSNNYSEVAASVAVSVTVPGTVTPVYSLSGELETLTWARPSSAVAIDYYEIRVGASFGASTRLDSTKATSYQRRVDYGGARTYWVVAVDTAGGRSAPGSAGVTIASPGPVVSSRQEVVDNNVLLFWSKPTSGSLPINRYEVRKGVSWAAGAVVGSNADSTFTTVFEQQAGDYTYWINAYDSAGNAGTPVGIAAKVSQPPDYVLRVAVDFAFAGAKTNMYVENGKLLGPVDTSETWATHFTSRGWTTIQNQIDAGYPLYINPSVASGTYQEDFDYGTVLTATTVTATLGSTVIAGSVTVACQIYYKVNVGDAWTAVGAGLTSVLISSFRYIRVTWTFTTTVGNNLIEVSSFNLKLANKLKTDSGSFVITNATAGVFVPFGVAFVDADTPLCQPAGTTALVPIVDFSDVPNPTGFTVYLHNPATGVKVTGSGSWTARGY